MQSHDVDVHRGWVRGGFLCSLVLVGCVPGPIYCDDSCPTARDGRCDDGQLWAEGSTCAAGSDCSDCGPNFDAPAPAEPGVDDTSEAFGARRRTSPVHPPNNCLGPPPVVPGWYCANEREFYYQGRRGEPGGAQTCTTTVGYYCGTDRRCVTDPSSGFAVGCMLDGHTDPTARIRTCRLVGCCDTGVELEWCSDVPAMRPIPPDFHRNDVVLWYDMGTVHYVYQDGTMGPPSADDSGTMLDGWCRTNSATRYVGMDACSMGMCLASCPTGTACVDGTCVGDGALRFTLTWSARADLDLHVTTPAGNTLSFRNRSADGGMLDRDNTSGGPGAVENIFFSVAANGTYQFWVHHYSGDPASFDVRVWAGGREIDRRGGSLDPGTEGGRWTITYP